MRVSCRSEPVLATDNVAHHPSRAISKWDPSYETNIHSNIQSGKDHSEVEEASNRKLSEHVVLLWIPLTVRWEKEEDEPNSKAKYSLLLLRSRPTIKNK